MSRGGPGGPPGPPPGPGGPNNPSPGSVPPKRPSPVPPPKPAGPSPVPPPKAPSPPAAVPPRPPATGPARPSVVPPARPAGTPTTPRPPVTAPPKPSVPAPSPARPAPAAAPPGAPKVDDVQAALSGPVRRGVASAPAEVPTFRGREPYPLDFFSLGRLAECSFRDLPRIGVSQRPAEDAARFCQEPSLAFAPTTISDFRTYGVAPAGRVFVNFMGMLGPNGPMPLHLTDYARDRERNQADPTLARFFDLFNHRMVSLFYRAWASTQMTTNYDRTRWPERGAPVPASAPAAPTVTGAPGTEGAEPAEAAAGPWSNEDRYAMYIGALLGIGQRSLRRRDAAPDVAKLYFSGRLGAGVKNAEGLRALLEEYFEIPARVDEFVGSWIDLPERYWCRLGESRQSGLLGVNAVAGSRSWDRQSRIRIVLGPMDYADYERMLPGGESQKRLEAWVRNYIGFEMGFDVQLVLKESEVPKSSLGKGGKLGWTTWTAAGALGRDPADLVMRRE